MPVSSLDIDVGVTLRPETRLALASSLARDRGHTLRTYSVSLGIVVRWCAAHGLDPLAAKRVRLGVSARAMLEALIDGERDPAVLADLSQRLLRRKIPELTEALQGRFGDHHAFLVRQYLDQIDAHQRMVDALTERIEQAIAPFRSARDALTTIPGISTTVAEIVIAETGGDMAVFPTAAHLASWAGVCPGQNESAGRVKSARTRHGNVYLKAALGPAALSASRMKNTYLGARYRRIAARRGGIRAVVAIEHSILTAVWHMLTTGEVYLDPGADYYQRLDPKKAANKSVRQLQSLGYEVVITPAAA